MAELNSALSDLSNKVVGMPSEFFNFKDLKTTETADTYQPVTAGWDILKQAPFSGSGLDGNDDLATYQPAPDGSCWTITVTYSVPAQSDIIDADLSLTAADKGGIPATMWEYAIMVA